MKKTKIGALLHRKDLENSESAALTVTPYGGFALHPYIFYREGEDKAFQYAFDRKVFLKASLGWVPPMPDTENLFKGPPKKSLPPPMILPNPTPAPSEKSENHQGVEDENPSSWLCLYKASEGDTSDQNNIRTHLESTLKTLSSNLTFFNIEEAFPSQKTMEKVKAVVSWFKTPVMKNSGGLPELVKRAIAFKKESFCFWKFRGLSRNSRRPSSQGSGTQQFFPALRMGISGE